MSSFLNFNEHPVIQISTLGKRIPIISGYYLLQLNQWLWVITVHCGPSFLGINVGSLLIAPALVNGVWVNRECVMKLNGHWYVYLSPFK